MSESEHQHEHQHQHGHEHQDGHEHQEGHEHEQPTEIDTDTAHNVLMSLVHELEEQFGDREPTEDEVLEFLQQRLRSEGRSEEDVQRFMEQLRD